MEWIADKDYDYQTESEQLLEELETASKEDEYFDAIEATLATLKEELQHDKSKDLISYKNEIKIYRFICRNWRISCGFG